MLFTIATVSSLDIRTYPAINSLLPIHLLTITAQFSNDLTKFFLTTSPHPLLNAVAIRNDTSCNIHPFYSGRNMIASLPHSSTGLQQTLHKFLPYLVRRSSLCIFSIFLQVSLKSIPFYTFNRNFLGELFTLL